MTVDVSRETKERLTIYAQLLRRWNPKINLVAPSTLADLETRHIKDCWQLTTLTDPTGSWVDLGSGAGLPGIILAICWDRPSTNVTLVESDARKASFLRTVVRETGLAHVTVVNERIEQSEPLFADQISARALAPLDQLFPYIVRHLKHDGVTWLMKGRRWRDEVSKAREAWSFDCLAHRSLTDDDAIILELTGIKRG